MSIPARIADAADPTAPTITRAQFFKVFPSVCLPMFLASVDQTIVATALPNIAGSLGDVERVSWVVVAYLMATTIAAPVYGRLGDVLGRRRLLFMALTIFLAASVLCAIAPTMLALIAARVLQGAGGGGLMTLSQALVGEIVPPRERPRFQGYLAGTFMVSSTFGPVAGGWLTQHFGWTSVFYVNLPLGALAMALAFRLPNRKAAGARFRFDWLGMGLLAGFVIPLLLALERVQRMSAAAVPVIIGLVALAGASLWLLIRQERRAASPLIPIRILSMPSIWRSDAMAACVGATIVGAVTFMPIYLQVVRGADPARVGLLLLPLTAGIALGSIATGRMMVKTGRTAIFPSIGQPIVAAGWFVLAIAGPSIPLGWLPVLLVVIAVATGTTMPVVQLTVQIEAGPKNLGAASASVQFTRSIGAALGTASVGAVLFAVLAAHDPVIATLFADIVERGPGILATVTPQQRVDLSADIIGAFRAAFLTVGSFSAVAALLAWSLPARRIT
ncbi:MAG: MDR family MFS transporter [Acetobacteraceae bacterium]|nr:MDR family MFS transporter [Acetobacteraceae bacterium]